MSEPIRARAGGGTYDAGVLFEDPVTRTLVVVIGRYVGLNQVEHVVGIGAEGTRVEGGGSPDAVAPDSARLRLQADVGRALLDALARHFGDTGSARDVRKDYDAERARVDALTRNLMDVAGALAMPPRSVA
jgi:hypothetical protein